MSEPLALHRLGPAEGLPLVLLHAFPVDSAMWDGVAARLPDLPLVTVDAPGFGDSPPPDETSAAHPTLEGYADAVARALTGEGIRRAVVAGLSMGGYAALALVERHPALVAGLGLLDTKATGDGEDARDHRIAVAAAAEERGSAAVAPMVGQVLGPTTREQRPAVVEQLRRMISCTDGPAIAWAQRAMAARPDRLEVLRSLGVPALVLRGEEDALSPAEAAEAMVGALGDAELVVVPGSGHLSAMEDPGAVAVALRRLHERAVGHEARSGS